MVVEPILTFEQITSVDSIDALVRLYAQNGVRFQSEKEFLRRLNEDWSQESERVVQDALESEPPLEPRSVDVKVDGVMYNLYGINHSLNRGQRYRDSIKNAARRNGNWAFEYGATKYLGMQGLEIPDWIYLDQLDEFLQYAGRALIFKRRKKVSESLDMHLLNVPLDVVDKKFPAYVRLELCQHSTPPDYSTDEKRSAYMGEFLRHWKKGEDKSAVVGGAHVPEIKYFLLKGSMDAEIIDRATTHATMAESDPQGFQQLRKDIDRKAIFIASLGYYVSESAQALVAAGVVCGAGYGIFELVQKFT